MAYLWNDCNEQFKNFMHFQEFSGYWVPHLRNHSEKGAYKSSLLILRSSDFQALLKSFSFGRNYRPEDFRECVDLSQGKSSFGCKKESIHKWHLELFPQLPSSVVRKTLESSFITNCQVGWSFPQNDEVAVLH